jgi:hypothetical protein
MATMTKKRTAVIAILFFTLCILASPEVQAALFFGFLSDLFEPRGFSEFIYHVGLFPCKCRKFPPEVAVAGGFRENRPAEF